MKTKPPVVSLATFIIQIPGTDVPPDWHAKVRKTLIDEVRLRFGPNAIIIEPPTNGDKDGGFLVPRNRARLQPRRAQVQKGGSMKRRWQIIKSYVLCEYHGEVHQRQADVYDMGERECNTRNWRNLAALSTPADIDGY